MTLRGGTRGLKTRADLEAWETFLRQCVKHCRKSNKKFMRFEVVIKMPDGSSYTCNLEVVKDKEGKEVQEGVGLRGVWSGLR